MMKIGFVVGAALALAPAMALADQPQNQPQHQNEQQMKQGAQGDKASDQATEDTTSQRILPKDAKLVGATQSTELRSFPEQEATNGKQSGQIQKEAVVGVGALDRVWTTKQPYQQTVKHIDQKLKGEGIEPIAKTTTQSATAWNLRMPDGHISNVVVRNTQPTTIESVTAAAVVGTMPGNQAQPSNQQQQQQQQRTPSSKSTGGEPNQQK
jgi:hypothetical protein